MGIGAGFGLAAGRVEVALVLVRALRLVERFDPKVGLRTGTSEARELRASFNPSST